MTTTRLQSATSAAALLTLALLAQSASAQPSAAQQTAVRQHCRTDFMALCARVKPGGKEALACLGKNIERLSPACQDAVYAMLPEDGGKSEKETAAPAAEPEAVPAPRAPSRHIAITSAPPPPLRGPHRTTTVKQTAATSIAAAPADEAAPPREPAVKTAKKRQLVKLAPQIKRKVEYKPPRATHARVDTASAAIRTCRTDLARFCRTVRPGGGREFACLASHRIFLSSNCRAAITVVGRAH